MPSDAPCKLRQRLFYRGALLAVLAAGSCAPPDAATSDRRAPGDRFDPDVVLSGSAADDAVAAMQVPAAGRATRPLLSAAPGVRWSDVPMAIENVASVGFLGIPSMSVTADRVEAVTVSADGQRGSVVATRGPGAAVAFAVQAGTFADPARDGDLARALDRELRRLATIRRPQD